MIASLPMYWQAETAGAWLRFWDLVRARLPGLPDLMPPETLPARWTEHWLQPDLALSMTCGLPLRSVLRTRVTYVGTFDFGLDCPPGHYFSRIVGPSGGLPDGPLRLAFNSADSQSGWAARFDPDPAGAPARPIGTLVETGSHAGSLQAVAEGRADIAYLDAVSWRLLEAHDPAAGRVRLLGRTPARPGLPLICAAGRDPAPLRSALAGAVAALPSDLSGPLGGLRGFEVLDQAVYMALPLPPAPDPERLAARAAG